MQSHCMAKQRIALHYTCEQCNKCITMQSNAYANAICFAYANAMADCMSFESNMIMGCNITTAIKSRVTDALSDALKSAQKQPNTRHTMQTILNQDLAAAESGFSTVITIGMKLACELECNEYSE